MKTACAVTVALGSFLWGVATPATALPIGSISQLTDTLPLVQQARWVCNSRGDCVWRGASRRTFYYGPANWRHCDYRWRTGRHGPYRERLCW